MKDSLGDEEKKEAAAEGTKTPLIRIEAAEGPGPEAAIEHIDTADSEEGQLLGDSAAVGSTTSSKGKDKAADAESVTDKPAAAVVPGQGMAGKINVLMAADVESIVEGMSDRSIRADGQVAIFLWSSYTPPSSSPCVSSSFTASSAGVP
jgi:hypothetical protein